MLPGFLIALVALSALACPLMMLLGRRAIGSGCELMRCRNSADSIRARQRELSEQIVDRLCMSFRVLRRKRMDTLGRLDPDGH